MVKLFDLMVVDIYIAGISSPHEVCAKDHFIAIVSTICETSDPEKECEPGLALLGPIMEKFVDIANLYEPAKDGTADGLFISKSYDASSHFESVCQDVKSIYKRVTGEELKVEGKVKKTDDDGNVVDE
jgi:Rab GDP dissociation inhibitor